MNVSYCSDEQQPQDVQELVGVTCFGPTDFQRWAVCLVFLMSAIVYLFPVSQFVYIWKYIYSFDYGIITSLLQKIQQYRKHTEKELKITSF